MKTDYLKYLWCLVVDHDWRNPSRYPVHGFMDTPHWDSYCDRCGLSGRKYLGVK